jgi:hypothetical protein
MAFFTLNNLKSLAELDPTAVRRKSFEVIDLATEASSCI